MTNKAIRLSTGAIELEASEAPKTFKILSNQKIYVFGREIHFTKKKLMEILKNFKEGSLGHEVPINFGHHGRDKHGAAGGWIKELEMDGNDLKITAEWNKLGKESVENKEYGYHSVGVWENYNSPVEKNKKLGAVLFELSLTNSPANAHIDSLVELEKNKEDEEMTEKEKLELEAKIKALETEREAQRVQLEKDKADVAEMKKELLKQKLVLSRESRSVELDALIQEGRVTPAQKKDALELSEEAYKGFKLAIPSESIVNTEPKGSGEDTKTELTASTAGEEIHRQAVELEKKEEGLDYPDAVERVLESNPELAKEYQQ